tara:strand:- start:667 stop:933 length:267 start_codon:yes stop_codon:yes gene_type:complete
MSERPFEIKSPGLEKNYSAPKNTSVKVSVDVNIDIPEDEQRYEIQELATTGWECIESDLTKENCKQKWKHYFNVLGLPPGSMRIRRIK